MSGTVYRNSVKVKGELAAPSVPSYMKMASPVAGYSETTGQNRTGNAVLAPNGKIYCIPGKSTTSLGITVLDPLTGETEELDCGTWFGWTIALAPDGIIYCFSSGSNGRVMTINPETHEVNTSHQTFTGTDNYLGCALHPNGLIYCAPADATSVGVYDYVTNTFTVAPTGLTGLPAGTDKWYGCCVAPSGKIYCAPYGHNSVLIIDPYTPSVDYTTMASFSTYTDTGWRRGNLAPNGKIYFAPRDSSSVLIVDPSTDTADETTITGLGVSGNKYCQGILAPNGKIYCLPIYKKNVLIIDPMTDTVDTTTYTGFDSGDYKYYFSILGPNGKIYSQGWGIYFYKMLELTPGGIPILPIEPLLSPYVNHG